MVQPPAIAGWGLARHSGNSMTANQQSLADLQRDIADRLRPVCAGVSDESFDALVRDIAAVKLKYGEQSEASPSVRRRTGSPSSAQAEPSSGIATG